MPVRECLSFIDAFSEGCKILLELDNPKTNNKYTKNVNFLLGALASN